jgi:hypothetical protein
MDLQVDSNINSSNTKSLTGFRVNSNLPTGGASQGSSLGSFLPDPTGRFMDVFLIMMFEFLILLFNHTSGTNSKDRFMNPFF